MKNYDEAAQCRVLTAKLVAEYFLGRDEKPSGLPISLADFTRIGPNLPQYPGLSFSWHEGGVIQSPDFTDAGYVATLESVAALLEKSEHYEPALEALLLLQRYYVFNRKFSNVASVCKHAVQCSDAAATSVRLTAAVS